MLENIINRTSQVSLCVRMPIGNEKKTCLLAKSTRLRANERSRMYSCAGARTRSYALRFKQRVNCICHSYLFVLQLFGRRFFFFFFFVFCPHNILLNNLTKRAHACTFFQQIIINRNINMMCYYWLKTAKIHAHTHWKGEQREMGRGREKHWPSIAVWCNWIITCICNSETLNQQRTKIHSPTEFNCHQTNWKILRAPYGIVCGGVAAAVNLCR